MLTIYPSPSYSEKRCVRCGYVPKLCDHKNTKESIKSETTAPLDAQRHMATYSVQIICVDCGKIVSARTDQKEAAHSFAATEMNGRTVQYCAPCGYNSVCGIDGHDWDEETYITENGDRAARCLFCGKEKIIDTKEMIDALDEAIRDGGAALIRETQSTYNSFKTIYNLEHQQEIRKFAENKAAKFYAVIAGDAGDVAMQDTVESVFLFDKLMTRMAGDEGWKDIDLGTLENFLSLLGVSEEWFNSMVKAGDMRRLMAGKESFSKEDLKKIFDSPDCSRIISPIVKTKKYAEILINVIIKCQRYSVAYENMGDSVDAFVKTLKESGMTSLASLLRDCKNPADLYASVIAMEICSGLELSDTVRDKIMSALPGSLAPLSISYKAATAFNDMVFNTTDTLAAGFREYWAMEAAIGSRSQVTNEYAKLCESPDQDQYNRLLAAYMINSTFVAATFDGTADFIQETKSGGISVLFNSEKTKNATDMYKTLANVSSCLNLEDFEGDSAAYATVTGGSINIRAGASKDTKKIGYAVKGDQLQCIDIDPETGWIIVLLEDGTVGYVAPSLVSVK